MACSVVAKGDTKYDGVVVNGYYEMTILDFIVERINEYRKRSNPNWTDGPKGDLLRHRIPSRPEPDLNRKV